MSLLDQLTGRDTGVAPSGGGVGAPSWRPAKERAHPDSLEGVIVRVMTRAVNADRKKDGGPTHDTCVVIKTDDAEWAVWGSVRDLRDRFATLQEEGLLVPGTKIAIKFFGSRKETAADGTPYSVHSYALAAEKGDEGPMPF